MTDLVAQQRTVEQIVTETGLTRSYVYARLREFNLAWKAGVKKVTRGK